MSRSFLLNNIRRADYTAFRRVTHHDMSRRAVGDSRFRGKAEFVNPETSCVRPLSQATLTKPSPGFTILLPCFFPVYLAGTLQIPSGVTKGV
jgi:hypothetical protein